MEKFDVIVVGSGSGMLVASAAVEQGYRVALVENGRMGGTCINVGCVPSKMLIYPADVLSTIRTADKIGVKTTINPVDFNNIMTRMRNLVANDSGHQATAVQTTPEMMWFKEKGEFISDYTLQVGAHTITAKAIFIASGVRTAVPPIEGIQNVNYLTSDTVLELTVQPKSVIIVGGGYIGMEYGHFFSSIGTKTTIVQRPSRLLPEEEPEISDLLRRESTSRMDIFTDFEALEVKQQDGVKTLIAKSRVDGTVREFSAEALMIATGRVSNTDVLKPEKTGVKLDEHGFIIVNDYLETSKKGIYAFGDAIGKQMFKHAANYEAGIVWHNSTHDHKAKMDFSATPHAVFTHPQIASVGLKQEEAKAQKFKFLVGYALYRDTAMGAAMGNPEGFVKVIVEQQTSKILGAHIIGPEAAVLIQEVTNAMISGNRDYSPIARGMHIHPALNEVVQNAFGNLQDPDHEHGHDAH
ncbi:MAG TPA: dihydrolipoyl dehydrogenase [Candidatus Deferrimicrobiaceae bacterium]|nr:dihydrolipoyl dehydrogenase [Candidatus Deferrimicrobiaceae bacterium]